MCCSSGYGPSGRIIVTIYRIGHEAEDGTAPGEVKVNGMEVSRNNPMVYFMDVETEAQRA